MPFANYVAWSKTPPVSHTLISHGLRPNCDPNKEGQRIPKKKSYAAISRASCSYIMYNWCSILPSICRLIARIHVHCPLSTFWLLAIITLLLSVNATFSPFVRCFTSSLFFFVTACPFLPFCNYLYSKSNRVYSACLFALGRWKMCNSKYWGWERWIALTHTTICGKWWLNLSRLIVSFSVRSQKKWHHMQIIC